MAQERFTKSGKEWKYHGISPGIFRFSEVREWSNYRG